MCKAAEIFHCRYSMHRGPHQKTSLLLSAMEGGNCSKVIELRLSRFFGGYALKRSPSVEAVKLCLGMCEVNRRSAPWVEVSFSIADLIQHGRCANWYREQAPTSQLGPHLE